MPRTEKQDVYTRITNQIVSHLEKGVRPWVRPWNAEHAAGRITRPLRHNGKPYSGINVLSLWASAMAQNFAAPIWMTFKQASELDAHIRKGEKGSLVVYADSITRKETDEKTGDEIDREIPFLKGYTVFNVEQIEGLPEVYYAKAAPTLDPVARIDHSEKFFAALGATIRHGGNRAFYSIAADAIQMPPWPPQSNAPLPRRWRLLARLRGCASTRSNRDSVRRPALGAMPTPSCAFFRNTSSHCSLLISSTGAPRSSRHP